MRLHDQYEFACDACGAFVKTETRITTCPGCSRELEVQWQGEIARRAVRKSEELMVLYALSGLHSVIERTSGFDKRKP